jgi:hypothetical protein
VIHIQEGFCKIANSSLLSSLCGAPPQKPDCFLGLCKFWKICTRLGRNDLINFKMKFGGVVSVGGAKRRLKRPLLHNYE